MDEYIKKIKETIPNIKKIELKSQTSNTVFKVTTADEVLYVKFYENNSFHIDNELKLYELVPSKYLKELYCKAKYENMAVFKELKGKTVDELSNEEINKYCDQIIDSLIDYFNSVSKVKVNGYGTLNNKLEGQFKSFLDFLKQRQETTAKNLKDIKELFIISSIIFEKYESILSADNSLVPIDTNMKNIMITTDGKVKFIDPGEMISAPILMGYGDFVAHTYKTKLYERLIEKLDLNEEEKKLIRIYAIFSSLNILSFLKGLGVEDLTSVIPYGNTETFYNLIMEHLEQLNISKDEITARILAKNI